MVNDRPYGKVQRAADRLYRKYTKSSGRFCVRSFDSADPLGNDHQAAVVKGILTGGKAQ